MDQIATWGAGHYMPDITIECINTSYKQIDREYDLMILDEVHQYLSEEFKKVHEIKAKKVLALTATLPSHDEEKTQLLLDTYPICFQRTLADGIDLGLVNPFLVYNLAVSFTKREKFMYITYTDQFNSLSKKLKEYIKILKDNDIPCSSSSFDLAKIAKGDTTHPMNEIATKYWKAMTLRKWVCYNAFYKR